MIFFGGISSDESEEQEENDEVEEPRVLSDETRKIARQGGKPKANTAQNSKKFENKKGEAQSFLQFSNACECNLKKFKRKNCVNKRAFNYKFFVQKSRNFGIN